MAEPAQDPVYDENDERPISRPDLRVIEGGGESSEPTTKKENVGAGSNQSLSGDELKAAEAGGDGGQFRYNRGSAAESHALGHSLGKGFNPLDTFKGSPIQRFIGLLGRNKKKTAGGAVAGGVIGGGIFMFSIVQGPLQFVHLAQLLQQYHFSSVYDETDDRFGKLSRYIYHRKSGEIERTRLGYFQNKYADKISERLKEAGIESEYNSRTGFKNRTRILPQFAGEANISAEELKRKVDAEFPDAQTYVEDGKVYINNKDMGFFKNRAFEKSSLQKAGYSRTLAAVNGRVMSKRAGYVLHPFKKLDKKALEKYDEAYEKWKKERQERISKGSEGVSRRVEGKGEKGETDEETTNNQQEANGEAEKVNDEIEKFRNSTSFKAIGGTTAAISIGCLAKSLDDGYGEIREQQVVAPLIRMAMDIISVGAQVQSGDDFNIQQLDFMNRQLHDKDKEGKKSSFNQAQSLLGEQGKKNAGVEESPTLKGIGNGSPFAFVRAEPISTALSAGCSTAGQIIQVGVGLLTGPISFAAGTALSAALGPVAQEALLDHLTGKAVDPLAAGAEYGNNVNYGARLAANSQMSSNGGRPLSTGEERQLALLQAEEDNKEIKNKGFFARIFNVYDHTSFTAKLIDGSAPVEVQRIPQVASSFLSPSSLLQSFFSVFSAQAKADNYGYDYGFAEVGFSAGEMQNPKVENPYANAEKVVKSILPRHSDYIDRAKKCFGVKIDDSTYEVTPLLDKTPTFEDVNSGDCKDKSTEWMQVRMYVFDSNVALSAACYEGDDNACSQIGAGSSASSSSSNSTGGTVSGSDQELAQEIMSSGKITGDPRYMAQIKAIAQGNGKCNVSGYILQMLTGLARDGHSVYISSLNRFCTGVLTASGTGSYHYRDGGGHAIDITSFDGSAANGGNSASARYLDAALKYLPPEGVGVGQFQAGGCGISYRFPPGVDNFSDSCNHVHIQVPIK